MRLNGRIERAIRRHAAQTVVVADYFRLAGERAARRRSPTASIRRTCPRRTGRRRTIGSGSRTSARVYGTIDLAPVLAALERLIAAGEIAPDELELRIVGGIWLPGFAVPDGVPLTQTRLRGPRRGDRGDAAGDGAAALQAAVEPRAVGQDLRVPRRRAAGALRHASRQPRRAARVGVGCRSSWRIRATSGAIEDALRELLRRWRGGRRSPRRAARASACSSASRGASSRGSWRASSTTRTASVSGARVLVAGWVNSPHVVAWGDALLDARLRGPPRGPAASSTGRRTRGTGPLRVGDRARSGIRAGRPRSPARARTRAGGARRSGPTSCTRTGLPGYGWMAAKAGLRPLVTSAWGSDLLRASRRLNCALAARAARLGPRARRLRAAGRRSAEARRPWGAASRSSSGASISTATGPIPDARAAARRRLGVEARPVGPDDPRARRASTTRDVLLDAFSRAAAPRAGRAARSSSIPAQALPAGDRGARWPSSGSPARSMTVVGFVDDDALADLYRAADVVRLDPVAATLRRAASGRRSRAARPPSCPTSRGRARRCATASTRCWSRSTPSAVAAALERVLGDPAGGRRAAARRAAR